MATKCPNCQFENPDGTRFCGSCAAPLESSEEISISRTKTIEMPVQDLTPGEVFAGRYQVVQEMGKGGMGRVYRAADKELNEEVALKLIRPEIAADKKTIERFKNELKLARKIRHRNVCGMYELMEAEGKPFITMEYVEGEDLESFIRRKGKLTDEETISISKQVCEGLVEAHRLGVIHRDLKPSNIMIDRKGDLKIMDFGIARSVEAPGVTQTGVMVGTPDYISPEQAGGEEADQRSDIYSLGVILYEMVTGDVPFKGDTAFSVALKHRTQLPQDPRKLNPEISENLSRVILKCMEKDRKKRYQNAGEVYSAFDRIEKGLPVDVTPSKMRSLFLFLKERKIIETLAAFIAGGWLILEVVHWILIDHYHFPEETLDIAIITLLCALICTLIWRFFGGIEKKRRKLKIEYIVISVIILITAFFDMQLFQNISISEEEVTREAITPIHKQLTFIGDASSPAISPDGEFIAYIDGGKKIMVQDMATNQALELLSVQICYDLQWTPDGSELSFFEWGVGRPRGAFLLPRLGGTPRKIPAPIFLAWAPDGFQFCGGPWPGQKTFLIGNKSEGITNRIELDLISAEMRCCDWSPLGNLILILKENEEQQSSIWTIKPDGAAWNKVTEDIVPITWACWSSQGDAIYYLRGWELEKELWKISVAPDTGKPLKSGSIVLTGLQAGDKFSITNDGKRLLYTRELHYSNLWLVTIEGSGREQTVETKQLTSGTLTNSSPSISPDGSQIAFSRGGGTISNIYTMPVDGGSIKQITYFNSLNTSPVWSPDGKEIAFASNEGGVPKVWKIRSQGGTPHQFTKSKLSNTNFLTWSPQPNILYQRPGNRNFHILNPETEEEIPLIKDDTVGWASYPQYSPDGKRVALQWSRAPSDSLWIISLEDSSEKLIKKGIFWPLGWSDDGEWIHAREMEVSGKYVRIESRSGKVEELPVIPFTIEGKSMLKVLDGKPEIYVIEEKLSDIWVVKNFDPDVK